jgi:hypothetical protein
MKGWFKASLGKKLQAHLNNCVHLLPLRIAVQAGPGIQ